MALVYSRCAYDVRRPPPFRVADGRFRLVSRWPPWHVERRTWRAPNAESGEHPHYRTRRAPSTHRLSITSTFPYNHVMHVCLPAYKLCTGLETHERRGVCPSGRGRAPRRAGDRGRLPSRFAMCSTSCLSRETSTRASTRLATRLTSSARYSCVISYLIFDHEHPLASGCGRATQDEVYFFLLYKYIHVRVGSGAL